MNAQRDVADMVAMLRRTYPGYPEVAGALAQIIEHHPAALAELAWLTDTRRAERADSEYSDA